MGDSSIEVHERGAPRDGKPQVMDRRLFMQLLVFQIPTGTSISKNQDALMAAVRAANLPSVVYADANDPRGVGLLTFTEDPTRFVDSVRLLFEAELLRDWVLRPELTMIGRTYSSGYEQDLEFWLIDRPQQTVLNPDWDWAVWYPLRRSGAFEQLEGKEKGGILREHATIGRAYGAQDLAHDVRLACHGLDANDNEFVIGLIGSNLHRLSHVVQAMRGTVQTAQYIQQMGPFFVGRAIGRQAGTKG
ncbi:MAG: chlorite dismutase family protein [Myxococcales bacterium]|nr:chlorite dismutase family protein [Myxococcales bacterium]MDH3844657.1 chlorite dismutase family protein [Myxococcales bacterium]